jgi:hypothetical protein
MVQGYILQDFIYRLEELGLTDVLLPFLLIFTIFFAILQKTRVLGEDKKNMNMILSVVIALTVVIPHVTGRYPSEDWDPIVIMNRALPTVSVVVVAIIMLLVLIGLFGGEYKLFGVAFSSWISFLSIAIIVFIFGAAAQWWYGWEWFTSYFGSDAVSVLIILVVFGLIVAFIVSEPHHEKEAAHLGRFKEDMRNIFGGGGHN